MHRAGEFQPPSPTRVANTSARRCIGSTLLQSPARCGYSVCIRQIFDDTQQQLLVRQRSQDVIYPPLPNISRQVSPIEKHWVMDSPTRHDRRHRRGRSPSLNIDVTARSPPTTPHHVAKDRKPSSESWSDDSSYLNAEGLCVSTGLAASPDERVRDWLLATCDDDSESTTYTIGEDLNDQESRISERRYTIAPNEAVLNREEPPSNVSTANLYQSVFGTQAQRHVSNKCKGFKFNSLQA